MTEVIKLSENENTLLKLAQESPDSWFMTYEKFKDDIISLEEKGLVEMIHEDNIFGTVYYRYNKKTLH
jgi:hypothetical protein